MDEYFEFLLKIALIVFGIVTCWYWSKPKALPPGPKGLPFIGNSHQITPSTVHLVTHEWSKKYGPVISFYLMTKPVIALTGYEEIQDAFHKMQGDALHGRPQFAPYKRKPPNHGIIYSESDRWKEQRRFALSTLKNFGFGRPILEKTIMLEVADLVQNINALQGESFDPHEILSTAISNIICSMIFGHRFEKGSKLKQHLDELSFRLSESKVNNLSLLCLYPWLRQVLQALSSKARRFVHGGDETLRFMQDEISLARKKYNPRTSDNEPECLVHAYDKAMVEGEGKYFDDTQLLAMIYDLFLGGSDTTDTTMRWAVFYMASHPDIQENVHREIVDNLGDDEFPSYSDRTKLPFTEATLMEIQRCASILPISVPHKAMEDTSFMGYSIPKDAIIVPVLWAIHHDPRYFPEPDNFNPYRFLDEQGNVKRDFPLVQFGVGKRACLGESLARMELFLLFTSLMQNFKFTLKNDQCEIGPPSVGFLRSPAKFKVCAQERGVKLID